jgi:hypothetical protein
LHVPKTSGRVFWVSELYRRMAGRVLAGLLPTGARRVVVTVTVAIVTEGVIVAVVPVPVLVPASVVGTVASTAGTVAGAVVGTVVGVVAAITGKAVPGGRLPLSGEVARVALAPLASVTVPAPMPPWRPA